MKWKHRFSSPALTAGGAYCRSGKVRHLRSEGGGVYSAVVNADGNFPVRVRLSRERLMEASCICQRAREGSFCAHEASLMFYIELHRDDLPPAETPAPVQEPDDGRYHYFDMAALWRELRVTAEMQEKGRRMAASGEAVVSHIRIGYDTQRRYQELMGSLEVRFPQLWPPVTVRAAFTRRMLRQLYCSAPECHNFEADGMGILVDRRPCVHKAAAMVLLEQYLRENEPGDITDRNTADLMATLRGLRKGSAERTSCVRLEPRLERCAGELRVGFRIGKEKLYVLRSIAELPGLVEQREILGLGKNAQIDFARETFDADSAPLYELLRMSVAEAQRRLRRSARMGGSAGAAAEDVPRTSIRLEGTLSDQFFDAVRGRELSYTDKDSDRAGSTTLVCEERCPNVHMTVQREVGTDGVIEGAVVRGEMPFLIEGGRSRYCVEPGAFLRIPAQAAELLALLASFSEDGTTELRVGRKMLPSFYYTILPELRRFVTVEEIEPELLADLLPPEASFCFYLDAEDGVPSCRILAIYGEQEQSVMDRLYTPYLKEPYRDSMREGEVIETVLRYFPLVQAEEDRFVCRDEEEQIYEVLRDGLPLLLEMGEVRSTNAFQSLRIHRRLPVQMGVSLESGMMDLTIGSSDLTQEELLEVLRSYKLKKTYHRLRSGAFVDLDERVAELSEMYDAMHVTPEEFIKGKLHLPAYRALYLDKMFEQCTALYPKRDTHYKKLIKDFKTVKDSDHEVPATLADIMRSYQKIGHKWLRTLEVNRFGGILADDMGLGKTLQMISVLLAAKNEGQTGTSIIICPSSLVYNWLEELHRFAPELKAAVVAGTPAERSAVIKDHADLDVLITSYDLLKRDTPLYEGAEFLFEVLDEAQYIKNHTTAAAKSVKVLHAAHRFALTGTPIENRLSELWSIFDFLMPGFLYDHETFRQELELPIAKRQDEAAIRRLRRMVAPFILRRLKKDVLDLPEKLEETRFARFDTDQQHAYDGQVVRIRAMLDGESEETFRQNKLLILKELTRIRQICCDPSLLFEGYQGGSAKREACLELIRSAIEGEHRMLVFSQFTSMLALLQEDLEREGIPYYLITGATPKQERLRLVKAFNEGTVPVFLISLKAGGTGLNLTGADVVIHYDPWWNAAAQDQATDRAHRIGQEKRVTVYKLIAKDTIEEKICELQEKKHDLAEAILTGESISIGQMTKEELLELLS